MTEQLVKRFNVDVPIRERQEIPDSHKWVVTGYRKAVVEVVVDLGECHTLATTAANNKGKKSKAGPCRARAVFLT